MVLKIGDFVVEVKARYFFREELNEQDTLFFLEELRHNYDYAAGYLCKRGYDALTRNAITSGLDIEKTLRERGFLETNEKGEQPE